MSIRLSIGSFLVIAVHILGADSTSLTVVGLVRASGEFTIDGSWTRDNSTVFDGSVISTTQAASHVVLEDGTRIDIGLGSRSRIHHDHVTIEKGLAQVNAENRYAVVAGRIRIDSPRRTLVRVTDSRAVAVTALQGVTEVRNGKGMLVAMIPAGGTLEFSDAQTPDDNATVSGCLQRIESKSGNRTTVHYILRDQTTNLIVELVGPGLERLVGMTVAVTGSIEPNTKAISPATETIRVRDLNASSQQKCVAPPLGTPTGAAPPGAPSTVPTPAPGLSLPVKVGIIGGLAVGGTLGGLAATGVIGGGAAPTSPSPASR
jgi:hypothetical protein